jgi:hypothetical protein
MFHLSSLVIILVFGLVLSNNKIFFRGFLTRLLKHEVLEKIVDEFHTITLETAFVVRTFFFVVFGMTLDLSSLVDMNTFLIALAIVGILFGIRLVSLKIFGMKNIFPELLIAPRGLITVLLFFAIPAEYLMDSFDKGILLHTIILTSLIMMVGMLSKGNQEEEVLELNFNDWEELDQEIEKLKEKNNVSG